MLQVGKYIFSFKRSYSNDRQYRITSCAVFILVDGEEKLYFVADTLCSPKDHFNKNTGRKIALTRALSFLSDKDNLDKDFRQRVWSEYFSLRNGKKE